MQTSFFSYHLPEERIAQEPMRPRDHSRLLVLDRIAGTWSHHRFFEIGSFLRPGDLLVANESKVFNARLLGKIAGRDVEVFLLRPDEDGCWRALVKPGKRVPVGSRILFADGRVCHVQAKESDGTVRVDFHERPEGILDWTDQCGTIPLPPYIRHTNAKAGEYQTAYANTVGSVAAPTAGFHFTPELIEQLRTQGVGFVTITLHVGLGTFRPVQTDTLADHVMHEEWVHVPESTQRAITQTKRHGGRVIAIGTTSVRALESDLAAGWTSLFITPGHRFKTVDALITNFHLPRSTLLVLVSAFIGEVHQEPDEGRSIALRAYEDAIREGYRFYSFGDAMLIH